MSMQSSTAINGIIVVGDASLPASLGRCATLGFMAIHGGRIRRSAPTTLPVSLASSRHVGVRCGSGASSRHVGVHGGHRCQHRCRHRCWRCAALGFVAGGHAGSLPRPPPPPPFLVRVGAADGDGFSAGLAPSSPSAPPRLRCPSALSASAPQRFRCPSIASINPCVRCICAAAPSP